MKRAMALVARVMATRVAGDGDGGGDKVVGDGDGDEAGG